jgi:hypothetical protein
MAVKIQLRRGTTSQWTSDIVLSAGEVGVNTETNQIKVGDGSTTWGALPYFASGTITSVTAGNGITVYTTAGSSASSGAISIAIDDTAVFSKNIINAKGDLIVGTADDTSVVLPVGTTANHTLLVDSTTGTGVKWGAIPTLNQNTTGTAATVTTAAQPAITSAVNLASVGTITSGTWSATLGATSGASLTSLNASNLASGTVSSALMPAVMYTTDGAASTKKITIQNGGALPTTNLRNGDICFIY